MRGQSVEGDEPQAIEGQRNPILYKIDREKVTLDFGGWRAPYDLEPPPSADTKEHPCFIGQLRDAHVARSSELIRTYGTREDARARKGRERGEVRGEWRRGGNVTVWPTRQSG